MGEGMSLSVYDPRSELWRQTWVDNEGNYWAFRGRFEDGRLILSTEVGIEGKPVLLRMVFHNIEADELKWYLESPRGRKVRWLGSSGDSNRDGVSCSMAGMSGRMGTSRNGPITR